MELNNLTRRFGLQTALRSVTLTLDGGRIGLLGPNGAGKSTLLKILMGLLPPSEGTGRFLGFDLAASGMAVRRRIGYMSEADALIPGLTGAEYVALAGELYGMPPRDATRRAHEMLSYLGLEDARYRRLETYSTGMKQRLKLAQALVHDPPVLLLDEPTSGLDPQGREQMLRLLLTLGRDYNKSFLLSTHLLGDVERICESVVILDRGKVLRSGRAEDLKANRLDRYRIHLESPSQRYLAALQAEGVRLLPGGGQATLRAAAPAGWSGRDFFRLATTSHAVIRGLEPDEEDLEELFHRVLGEEAEGG